MKYYTKTVVIDEDAFREVSNLHDLARHSGIQVSQLCDYKNGKRIVSEKIYMQVRQAISAYLQACAH